MTELETLANLRRIIQLLDYDLVAQEIVKQIWLNY